MAGSLVTLNMQLTLASQKEREEENNRPAEISIVTIVSSSCETCVEIDTLLEMIQKQNVQINSDKRFEVDSEEAKILITEYKLERVPSVLVRGELEKDSVRTFFESLGRTAEDGTRVIEPSMPVYFDLTQNKLVGEVSLTTISDSTCAECYDPSIHESILKNNFGVTITKTEILDANSGQGKTYVQRYAIKELPAFLLSGDATSYDALVKTWGQVGTVEEDGTFVFRKNSELGGLVYKNLSTGTIVKPETQE